MIVDCISDLHGYTPKMPGGDLLLVAGDLTKSGTIKEMKDFKDGWLRENEQKYKQIIFIAGNHDRSLEEWNFYFGNSIYLCDGDFEFEGLKIWGTPWSLTFDRINPLCTAFTGTEKELKAKWKLIPKDVDILVTHGPPFGILDTVRHPFGSQVGSKSLLTHVKKNPPKKLHVFGHIHEAYGKLEKNGVCFVNCSHVDKKYRPFNDPVRIVL